MTRDRRTPPTEESAEPDAALEQMTDYLIRTGRARPTTITPSSAPAAPPASTEDQSSPAEPSKNTKPYRRVNVKGTSRPRRDPNVPRPRTVVGAQAVKHGRARAPEDLILEIVERPKTRGDCMGEMRPCPWVGCKQHLYLDVNPVTGAIRIAFPDLEPWELEHTCALDVADRGGITLEEVGQITNVSRERIRQVETIALLKIKRTDREFEDPIPDRDED